MNMWTTGTGPGGKGGVEVGKGKEGITMKGTMGTAVAGVGGGKVADNDAGRAGTEVCMSKK